MRAWMFRIVLSLPVMIVLGFTDEVRAQHHRSWAAGVGVGVGVYIGPGGYGPYWGSAWGFMPNYTYYNGSWGNGLSLYGPPVPTGKPVAGSFGGADSQYFAPPSLYPGWVNGVYIPLNKPAALPPGVIDAVPGAELPAPNGPLPNRPAELVPPPSPLLDKPAAMEIEVRLPRNDARVFIDGAATKSAGSIRTFNTPVQTRADTLAYDIRAEWTIDGLTTTHTKRVAGHAGERVVVEFTK
jgi:uncharacterized protein (TIGR03000 family)